jgi:AcrR family transcriptional regulator
LPRIAEGRPAAEPSSPEQHARHQRILEAAGQLGAETDFDHVQMHEVAKRAGVAIGTLYRYFPSKVHLFVGVLVDQIERMEHAFSKRPKLGGDPADRVFDVLVRANRAMLSRPNLARAMMNASSAAKAALVSDVARTDNAMRDVTLAAAGIDNPTPEDLAVVRVLLQAWGGILQSSLNGRLSMPDAESDLRIPCRLLMAGTSACAASQRQVG